MKTTTDDTLAHMLMSLPLFLGMSRNDIHDMLRQGMIDCPVLPGDTLVAGEGELCRRLIILAKGSIQASATADDHGYSIEEWVEAPHVIQPERMFGLTNRFSRTFTTHGTATLVVIDKADVVRMSDLYQIFRINLLNVISTHAQRLARMPWRHTVGDLRQRIVAFIASRCLTPIGEKHLLVKRDHLAAELASNERYVSDELRRMHEDGLLHTKRGCIIVDSLEYMLRHAARHD